MSLFHTTSQAQAHLKRSSSSVYTHTEIAQQHSNVVSK